MNCPNTRSRLLETEDPALPAADIRAHLVACVGCRQWHTQLVRLERSVPRLSVPSSTDARAGLLRRLASEPGVQADAENRQSEAATAIPVAIPAITLRQRQGAATGRGRRHSGWLAAAAAVFVAAFCAWALLRPAPAHIPIALSPRPPRDMLLEQLVERNLALAEAGTPVERVKALADLADDLKDETRSLVHAAPVEELMGLARLYDRVIRQGLAEQARGIAPADRMAVLGPVAGRLARALREAEATAQDVPAFADPLRLIAAAARDAGGSLPAPKDIPAASEAPPWRKRDVERLRMLERDRGLVQALVEGALRLASLDDSMGRADFCNALVKTIAEETRVAAERHEGPRAAELGDHLRGFLARGVASNLAVARLNTVAGSSRDLEIRRIGEFVIEITRPVEDRLRHASEGDQGDDMHHALLAVRGGWDDVRKAIGEKS